MKAINCCCRSEICMARNKHSPLLLIKRQTALAESNSAALSTARNLHVYTITELRGWVHFERECRRFRARRVPLFDFRQTPAIICTGPSLIEPGTSRHFRTAFLHPASARAECAIWRFDVSKVQSRYK